MNTEHKVISVIEEITGESVNGETCLSNIDMDSYQETELVVELELHFDIQITDETVKGWARVCDIISTINKQCGFA